MNPLLRLKKSGQSVWYDNLRRGLITSGELKRMMEEYGLAGVTSNPTIFEKAIAGTTEYDSEITRLIEEGLRDSGILERVQTEDIKNAADTLAPVYKETKGADGFVSIEVSPYLARNTEGTVKEALSLYSLVDGPNVMVKVPATAEGLPAIERLTYEGHNVNITLLFSVKRYEEVALAYIRGLERRAEEGKPVTGISSVASFFVSRVDTLADKLIEEHIERAKSNDEKVRLKELIGKVAVANAKLAYMKYDEIFGSDRFRKLKGLGALPQRLLWASTGTKNPMYSDVKYVEELIGPDTINTMPLQTILAFYDHGRVAITLDKNLDEARRVISELEDLGIDYVRMTATLEDEGIKSFSKSFDDLKKCVTDKRKALLEKRGYAVRYALNGFELAVDEAVKKTVDEHFLERLWSKDPTLWKTGPVDKKLIRDALGWLTLPDVMEEHKDSIEAFAGEVKNSGFTHAVLLGMGGSSLAPLVMSETFGHKPGYPALIVLDTTDPDAVKAVTAQIDPARTLFIVSSKSGSTIEPLSLFEYFYELVSKTMGEEAGRNFIAITDPGTALEGFAKKYRFKRLFLNPPDIGGRFSALSYFGLVPAAIEGMDISRLLSNAAGISAATHPCACTEDNDVIRLGAALGSFGRGGRDKITFFLSKEISSFGLWIEQLLAESTGKEGTGLVPIANEPAGTPEDYGDDRVFIYIGVGEPEAKVKKALKALSDAGHPVINFELKDAYEIGGEFLRWEVATAVAGQMLGINPFDQPDVELSKKLTRARLDTIAKKGALTPPGVGINARNFKVYFGKSTYGKLGVSDSDAKKAMKSFLKLLKKGDYIGMLAYMNPEDRALDRQLIKLRKDLRDATKAATQFGYGPRYLHSTGQLHKGGANKGLFIILCHETKEDLKIPGSPFGFSALELSQAFGDMEALDSKGCRVALIEMKDSSPGTVEEVESFLRGVAGVR